MWAQGLLFAGGSEDAHGNDLKPFGHHRLVSVIAHAEFSFSDFVNSFHKCGLSACCMPSVFLDSAKTEADKAELRCLELMFTLVVGETHRNKAGCMDSVVDDDK